MKNSKNTFKAVFFILLVFVLLLVAGAMMLIPLSTDMLALPEDRLVFLIMTSAMIFSFGLIAVIGRIVYSDAERHDMNPWLWLTVVVFVPNAVGIIIYLVVRSGEKKKVSCYNCGQTIQKDFANCPHCGVKLKKNCLHCNKPIDDGWKICPYCRHELA